MRDTKLEKQNHEATPKHQGNLQRFLRELHRGNEREEREKQRAKNEVARLNGTRKDMSGYGREPAAPASKDNQQATLAERKRQLQQLADMGVAVPDDARRDMAMAGDWQVQAAKPIYEDTIIAKSDEEDMMPEASTLAIGVRKRKFEDDEEKGEAGETVVREGWGSKIRKWQSDDNGELDNLLRLTRNTKPEAGDAPDTAHKNGSSGTLLTEESCPTKQNGSLAEQPIKREDSDDAAIITEGYGHGPIPILNAIKNEDNGVQSDVKFKKRKPKRDRARGTDTGTHV